MPLLGVSLPPAMFPHRVGVEVYLGETARGPSYAASYTIHCLIEDKRRLVVDTKGTQMTSMATLYCPPGTSVPDESRVTYAGKVSTADQTDVYDGGGLPLPGCVVVRLR